jgi:hypothetical protein
MTNKEDKNSNKLSDSVDNWQGVVDDWSGDKQVFDMRLLRQVMFVLLKVT